MFTEANNTNILRSIGGVIAATVLTVTVFYGAAGPDPRADIYAGAYTAGLTQMEAGQNIA